MTAAEKGLGGFGLSQGQPPGSRDEQRRRRLLSFTGLCAGGQGQPREAARLGRECSGEMASRGKNRRRRHAALTGLAGLAGCHTDHARRSRHVAGRIYRWRATRDRDPRGAMGESGGSGLGVLLRRGPSARGRSIPDRCSLHGSHGFAQEYVRLAEDLTGGGLLAVAACWFRGGGGDGARFITPIGCPEAPPMPNPASPEAMRTLDALVQAARTLPARAPTGSGSLGTPVAMERS